MAETWSAEVKARRTAAQLLDGSIKAIRLNAPAAIIFVGLHLMRRLLGA
jgi:hypothetical protein